MGDGDILPTLTRHLIRSVPHTLTQGRLARSKIKKKNKKKVEGMWEKNFPLLNIWHPGVFSNTSFFSNLLELEKK